MTLDAFYVLISRVREMSGLRLLQNDAAGIAAVGELQADEMLYAWERGYDECSGVWGDVLAKQALTKLREQRKGAKEAAAGEKKARAAQEKEQRAAKRVCEERERKARAQREKEHKREEAARAAAAKVAEAATHTAGKRPAVPTRVQERKEEPFIRHAERRLAELRVQLLTDSRVRVTIAGGNGRSYLGQGPVYQQWKRVCTDRRDKKAYENFMGALERGIEQLCSEFPSRVAFGQVCGSDASPTHLQVWGANADNWNLAIGSSIPGRGGDAAAMRVQCAGVFGIVTCPRAGPPE
jgi:hypothetical protein